MNIEIPERYNGDRRAHLHGIGDFRTLTFAERYWNYMDARRFPAGTMYGNGRGPWKQLYLCACDESFGSMQALEAHCWGADGRPLCRKVTIWKPRADSRKGVACTVCDQLVGVEISDGIAVYDKDDRPIRPSFKLEVHQNLAGQRCKGTPDYARRKADAR